MPKGDGGAGADAGVAAIPCEVVKECHRIFE